MVIIQGLEDYESIKIKNIILAHIDYLKENFAFEDLDFLIHDIILFGSRVSGFAKKKSDLDVRIKYSGNAKEHDLFNALNRKNIKLSIEDMKVDFYPEREERKSFQK